MTDKDFDIGEFDEILFGEEYRKEKINKLAENYRKQKSLKNENLSILSSFSDPEKDKRIFHVTSQAWGGVLESNTINNSVDDIMFQTLVEEDIEFFNQYRNKNYFPSGKVFEEHLEHPVQKDLTKKRYIGKREAKKQKTPMQTINYIYNAKHSSDKDDRLQQIEKSLSEAHRMITLLAVNQSDINSNIQHHSQEFIDIKQRLITVEKMVKDSRKVKLYALYTSSKKMTNQELADEVGISLRTCQYWLKELEELGVIALKRDKNT